MNIAFVDVTATVSFGGVQTAIWELARTLTDFGHQVTIYGGLGNIQPDLGNRPIQVRQFKFTPRAQILDLGSRFKRFGERWTFCNHALKTVAAAGHDWIVLTKPLDFFWPWRMPSDSYTKFCFMSGGTSFMAFDRKLAKKVDAWAACSHFNAWQIAQRYKRFPKVMFNGVDVDAFRPQENRPRIRAQLGYQPDDVVLAFAGRLVGWKGLAVVIKALAQPGLKNLAHLKLLLVGNGEQKNELIQLAQSCGLADRVRFHGAVPHRELPTLYTAADIGVFPSIGDEAFGITIAEAMASGLPVIASHIGGIPEVVGNEGGCGLLVEPGDVPAWAEVIHLLANDAERRIAMGQQARQRIVEHYTWAKAGKRFLKILENR